MTVFETRGHVALRLTLSGGEVSIETSAEPSVEIELIPLRDNDSTGQAIAEARVDMIDRRGGHEVVIQIPKKKSGVLAGRGAKIGVRVRCPRGSDLALRAGSADLEASGSLGAVEIKTASGDVSLEDVGSLDVNTGSGDVRVRHAARTIDVRAASGDATVRSCEGLLSANLVSGDLSVGEAAGGLAVTTVSGDVRVRSAGGGGMRIQAVSGDVELAITQGESLYIDASSVSGTMSSELGLEEAPPADVGVGVIELHIRTVSGDVQITRATAVGV